MKNQYIASEDFIYNQEANKIAIEVKKIIENSQKERELMEKQKKEEQEIIKEKRQQQAQEKLQKKKEQEIINERQNNWLENRKKQIENLKPVSKETTPSPAKIASSSNNSIEAEVLELREKVEIIKKKNREEKENSEKLKKFQEEESIKKLKEKTRPISTIENVEYYYQLRIPKKEEEKNYEKHTISSDPKQKEVTRIKIEELEKNLQTNQKPQPKYQTKTKENNTIQEPLITEIKTPEKNIKSCLKNSSANNRDITNNSKNIDQEISNFRNQLEKNNLNQASRNKKDLQNTIKIHKENFNNAKIAYEKHPLTKLQNKKNTTPNKTLEKPLNKISAPKIKYPDILEAFANKLKNQITK